MTRDWAQRWEDQGISVVALALGRVRHRVALSQLRTRVESGRVPRPAQYPEELTAGAVRAAPSSRRAARVRLAGGARSRRRSGALSDSTITLDEAAGDWWGPWPQPARVDAGGTIPTEERRGS